MATKIATCCYCGSRSALVLTGKVRHELACSTCGAPLHLLKMLKTEDAPVARATSGGHKGRRAALAPTMTPIRGRTEQPYAKPGKPPKRKSRIKGLKSFFEDIWDEVEDLFD